MAKLYLAVLASLLATPTSAANCETLGTNGPLQVTADCTDPRYDTPIIDLEKDENGSFTYHRVAGHFNGTSIDFNIYLPEKAAWKGRFFQLTYPTQNSTADSHAIAFGADSGAYTIQASGSLGYRADAALAKLSRKIARDYYQESSSRQIYGYLYGGSGGSYTTVGAIENTFGVWDGAIALVQAVTVSIPNNWSIRALGSLVLGPKKAALIDAVSPGGSGDPFSVLKEVERAVLVEVTALGVPLRALENFDGALQYQAYKSGVGLWDTIRLVAIPNIKAADPTYSDDFWTQPGYLGTEQSPLGEIIRNSLVHFNATVEQVILGPNNVTTGVKLNSTMPSINTSGLEFNIISKDGESGFFTGALDLKTNQVVIYPASNQTTVASLKNGTQLQINNRWHLAAHSYYRHQVPTSRDFYGYDYLRDASGQPRYPQRSTLLAPTIAKSSSGGGTHTGNITGKLIVMDNLLDYDAFPWHADWYRSQVQKALGEDFNARFRLYYADNADHQMGSIPQNQTGRIIDWTGNYQQLLNDLSAWVERGELPPNETKYAAQDGQVILPATAASRYGFQPVVELTIGGKNHTEVRVGQSVKFKMHAEAPPSTGQIVSLEWDFEGTGSYVEGNISSIGPMVDSEITHSYKLSGTYLPAVRVGLQREGNAKTPYRRVTNLGRARVTVS